VKPCTNVTFRHPAEFVDTGEGILAVGGAQWFAALLLRVPGLEIDEDLCQEDWGVVLFARRNRKEFRIGLSAWYAEKENAPVWDAEEGWWLAHFRHGLWVPWRWASWFQRLSSSGKNELKRLLVDVHEVLVSEAAISDIAWHEDDDMNKPLAKQRHPAGFPTPVG